MPPAGVASVRGHAIAVAVGPGIELETWIQGPDDGLPVLFIHGGYGGPVTTLLGTPPWFDGVFSTEDPVRLIRYSRRNAGASTYVLEPFDLPDLAADALGLLDALGVDRAVVIGSSAGGPVAVQLALTWPERVVALGLPNTAAAIMSDRPAGLDGLLSPMVMARSGFLGVIEKLAGALPTISITQSRPIRTFSPSTMHPACRNNSSASSFRNSTPISSRMCIAPSWIA